MDNFELMKILQKLSLSNRNKNLAITFGISALLGFIVAKYWYKKTMTINYHNDILSNLNHSLINEKNVLAGEVSQLREKINRQAIIINSLSKTQPSPENKA